nr:hypothetical protein CFP56_46352 [Quercus suber]
MWNPCPHNSKDEEEQGFGDGEAEVIAARIEAGVDLFGGVGKELGESVGREGREDGDCGGNDVKVGEIEIEENADDDGVPKIGGEMSGADEIEGELFGDGRGKGSNDFFNGRFGELFGFFVVNF